MTTTVISVSDFKTHCLDVIRQVENAGAPVDIVRRGKIVARLVPSADAAQGTLAWLRLRGRGALLATAEESVLSDQDFGAMRGASR